MPSYLRLVPQHWAGAFAAWGRENREAAIRFVTGMVGNRETASNTEVKCFDLSANPYLVTGAVIAAGLAGVEKNLRLPEEVTVDPGVLSEEELADSGAVRLPRAVQEAVFLRGRGDRDALGREAGGREGARRRLLGGGRRARAVGTALGARVGSRAISSSRARSSSSPNFKSAQSSVKEATSIKR